MRKKSGTRPPDETIDNWKRPFTTTGSDGYPIPETPSAGKYENRYLYGTQRPTCDPNERSIVGQRLYESVNLTQGSEQI